MRPTWLASLAAPVALLGCFDSDPDPIITEIPVATCAPDPALDGQELLASGTVIDFVTGAPQAGVTVDIARAWEPSAKFPADSCSVARLTTDAEGRFGPALVKIGPMTSDKYVVFLAQGGGIAPTASDARVLSGEIDHVFGAPSIEVNEAWRTELAAGGMDDARRRGLVAFRYDDADRIPAAGVVARNPNAVEPRPLELGREVRYLSADRGTIEPASRSTTTESGLALIGLSPLSQGTREIGGLRGTEDWGSIGCLVGEGWLFLEWSRPINVLPT